MIDKATVDRIYAAADIVEVVNDFVTLRKKGINYVACCPFHNEKTPSFVVSPTKGLFKCFGCGKGGNAVTFVMEHEGMNYAEALKYVAKKYNIEVAERALNEEEVRRNDNRESMMVLNSWAAEWFKDSLHKTEEGKSVGMSYFRHRGFSDTIIERFQLGYCPKGGETFTRAAHGAGYKEEFLTGTGLTIIKENGGYYDRFSERVMFPIHSMSGRVVAFGGRTLRTDKKVAKYQNSPESEIYSKRQTLYGIFFATKAIAQQRNAILVEGYTDVISMHQAGVENVVASSGTSLTVEQIALLKRFTDNITVIYDGDDAGIKASLRGIDMILREGLAVRVVLLPDGEDPDSFARTHNATELQDYIRTNEEDFLTFKSKLLVREVGGDVIKRAAVIGDMVSSIVEIPDAIQRAMYIRECSKIMDIDEQLLISEVAKKRLSANTTTDSESREFIRRQETARRHDATQLEVSMKGVTAGSSIEELEKELVRYLLKYGHLGFDFRDGKTSVELNVAETIIGELQTNGLTLRNPHYRALYDRYVELFAEQGRGSEVEIHNFITHPDADVCNTAVDLLTADDNYIASKLWKRHEVPVATEEQRLPEALPRAVILYKSKVIEELTQELSRQLDAENLSDEKAIEIIQRITALNREQNAISKRLDRLIL
jgi:DNA primase